MALRIVPDYGTMEEALAGVGGDPTLPDELQIRAGTYNPPAAGYVVQTGTLIRPFPGDEGLVIITAPAAAQDTWRIHAAGVELRDLDSTAWPALGCEAYAINADGVTLTRCIGRHNSRGFYASAAPNATINSCRAIGGAGAESGVRLDGAGGTIVNTFVSGTHTHGIRLSVAATVKHCTVRDCSVEGYSLHGAVTVRDSVAEANPGIGFHLHNAGADVDWICAHGNGTNTDVTAGTLGVHVTNADPKLTTDDAFAHDSICRDFDLGGCGVLIDRRGTVRPVGGSFDLGSYEFPAVAPRVLGAVADGLYHVVVTFDQGVAGAALTDQTAWAISALSGGDAVSVLSVSYDAATFRATLTTSAHTPDQVYRVTAPAAVVSLYGDALDPSYDTADYLTPQATGREAGDPWAATGDGMTVDLGAGPYELVPWAADAPLADLGQLVWISLFTDRRAEDGDHLPDVAGDPPYRGGWWADALTGDPIGSRLWLLRREPITDEVATLAREYAEEALAWLVSGGYASAVEATAERIGMETLALTVGIVKNDGTTVTLRYADLWAAFEG